MQFTKVLCPLRTKASTSALALRSLRMLLIVCGTALVPMGRAQSDKTAPTPPPPPPTKQVIYAPVSGIEEFSNWEIEIANRSNQEIPATVTVFSAEGKPFPSTTITLGSEEIRRMDIRSLLPRADGSESSRRRTLGSPWKSSLVRWPLPPK
jgi:hypothetical protein